MPLEFAHVSHMSRKSYAITPFLSKVLVLHAFIKEEKLKRTLFSQVFHQPCFILNPYTFTKLFPWKPEGNFPYNILDG